tara:strand:- start:243 stop:380 length:138 start_codon:yes stop_codon:yes gene_type:complete
VVDIVYCNLHGWLPYAIEKFRRQNNFNANFDFWSVIKPHKTQGFK